MKSTVLATLLCTTALIAPIAAQTPNIPDPKPAAQEKTTSELAFAAFTDMKNVLKIAGTANNLENAKKAITAIQGLTAKFPAQTKAITAADAPNLEERKKWAIRMLDQQQAMKNAVDQMNRTLNAADIEVQKMMAPAMQSFFLNVRPLAVAMEKHFPAGEQKSFEDAEKARRAAAKAKQP